MRLAVLADTAVACAITAIAAALAYRLGGALGGTWIAPGSRAWRFSGSCAIALALAAIAIGLHRRERRLDGIAIALGLAVLIALVVP